MPPRSSIPPRKNALSPPIHRRRDASLPLSKISKPTTRRNCFNCGRAKTAAKSRPFRTTPEHDPSFFSPDGGRLVSTSEDHAARLWDAQTGKLLLIFRADDWQTEAGFSADGQRLFTMTRGGAALISDLSSFPKSDLFHVVCALLPDFTLADLGRQYGVKNLDPICAGDPPAVPEGR